MAVVFVIKVVPQSGRQELHWDEKQGLVRVFVKSAPENNKANEEVLMILRKTLGVAHTELAIIAGRTARRKTIRVITDMTQDALFARAGLGAYQQQLCS